MIKPPHRLGIKRARVVPAVIEEAHARAKSRVETIELDMIQTGSPESLHQCIGAFRYRKREWWEENGAKKPSLGLGICPLEASRASHHAPRYRTPGLTDKSRKVER
jgi:hypothetical protein